MQPLFLYSTFIKLLTFVIREYPPTTTSSSVITTVASSSIVYNDITSKFRFKDNIVHYNICDSIIKMFSVNSHDSLESSGPMIDCGNFLIHSSVTFLETFWVNSLYVHLMISAMLINFVQCSEHLINALFESFPNEMEWIQFQVSNLLLQMQRHSTTQQQCQRGDDDSMKCVFVQLGPIVALFWWLSPVN